MKVLGITAEYNPFHSGHLYHLREALNLSKADYSVVAMSGNFTQRGEPAIFDKWIRSRSAVENGADMVVEIPFIFSCSRAEFYARGAVDLLVSMGVTHIAFGCEAETPELLNELVYAQYNHRDNIEQHTAVNMKKGYSYAKSKELAISECLGTEFANLILTPNNILAIEYIKRIKWWESKGKKIETIPIKRKGAGYFEVNDKQGFAGATEIRKMFAEGRNEEAYSFLPNETKELIEPYAKFSFDVSNRLFEFTRYEIIKSTEAELALIYGVGEGIENRLKKAAYATSNLQEFLNYLVSKRYTASAIRRILIYILMGVKKFEGPENKSPEYIRLLASSVKGRKFIKMAKKKEIFTLPFITNINKGEILDELNRDIKASDVYNILNENDLYKFSDHVIKPYIVGMFNDVISRESEGK